MQDEVLGKLREARALLKDEEAAGKPSRELSVTVTNIDTAVLWRQWDLQLKTPPKNEAYSLAAVKENRLGVLESLLGRTLEQLNQTSAKKYDIISQITGQEQKKPVFRISLIHDGVQVSTHSALLYADLTGDLLPEAICVDQKYEATLNFLANVVQSASIFLAEKLKE